MNLRGIVASAISTVNPDIPITVQVSTGYVVGSDYRQVPTYNTIQATGQVQPLSAQDLRHLDGLNIQGVTSAVYLNGDFEGVFRSLGKGGDLLMFNNQTWIVNDVIERWPDWVKLGVTSQ